MWLMECIKNVKSLWYFIHNGQNITLLKISGETYAECDGHRYNNIIMHKKICGGVSFVRVKAAHLLYYYPCESAEKLISSMNFTCSCIPEVTSTTTLIIKTLLHSFPCCITVAISMIQMWNKLSNHEAKCHHSLVKKWRFYVSLQNCLYPVAILFLSL